MKFFIIVNPLSKAKKEDIYFIEEFFKQRKTDYKIVKSSYSGHTTILSREISKEYNGKETTIIGVGGDGTINQIAEGLIYESTYHNVKVGIIPFGTANVLAKELLLPKNIEKNLLTIFNGKSKKVTLGVALSESGTFKKYFIFSCGVGLDGFVTSKVNLDLKKRFRVVSYILSFFKCLNNLNKLREFTVEIDGEKYNVETLILNKTEKYGGNFKIFKNASLFEDYFEILIIRKLTKLSLLTIFFTKETIKGRKIKILNSKDLYSQFDGDFFQDFQSINRIEISDKFINLIVP